MAVHIQFYDNDETALSTAVPGETVNRPRYTVDSHWILLSFLAYWLLYTSINEELDDDMPALDAPNFDWLCRVYVFIGMSGGQIRHVHYGFSEELKKKSRDIYRDFLNVTKLTFIGVSTRFYLNNICGVLHPVDNFLKHFYDRYHPAESVEAMRTYKRTNPTLPLKCAHLEKFAEPFVSNVPVDEMKSVVAEMLDELYHSEGFESLSCQIRNSVNNRSFDELQIDMTSAAGYPYAQGKKKRDVYEDALEKAVLCMDDREQFDSYYDDHVWYTTGRAKHQKVDAEDAGRLIQYGGFSGLMILLLFIQPWCRFMNKTYDWCGVGFSWMHRGANKFAEYFECNKGFAPEGFRYVSLDISSWDAKLHKDIMSMLLIFFRAMFTKIGLDHKSISMFERIVEDMISSTIAMPLGYLFKVFQGMKSGWGSTANDNTLLHEIIFRCIMKRIGWIKHVLYGDDNFLLVPDHIKDDTIVAEYARFGMKVKVIHSSRYIGDVDFLSKHIHYRDGNYYVFRESVETHSRLLMPEEMDPRRRERPDVVIAAERVIGHLLDNPFNTNVRNVCFDLLKRFKKHYDIHWIELTPEMRKRHPWRNFDLDKIPKRLPLIPSIEMIEELYGVPIPSHLKVSWPALPTFTRFSMINRDDDLFPYFTALNFSEDVHYKLSMLTKKKYRAAIRKMSPYSQPKMCYGFHAARLEFAIKYFSIEFKNVLDLGSHPGACAASLAKYSNDIVCVTLKPTDDSNRRFCPYIAPDDNIKIIKCDANRFKPNRQFDFMHDDVDVVGGRNPDTDLTVGKEMIVRATKNRIYVKQCLFTIKQVNWEVVELLYDLYKAYGHIDFVKPLFSNPWKSEFMVYVRVDNSPPIKKPVFRRALYAFLNSLSAEIIRWNETVMGAIAGFKGVGDIDAYPFQTEVYEKDWIRPWDHIREVSDM